MYSTVATSYLLNWKAVCIQAKELRRKYILISSSHQGACSRCQWLPGLVLYSHEEQLVHFHLWPPMNIWGLVGVSGPLFKHQTWIMAPGTQPTSPLLLVILVSSKIDRCTLSLSPCRVRNSKTVTIAYLSCALSCWQCTFTYLTMPWFTSCTHGKNI